MSYIIEAELTHTEIAVKTVGIFLLACALLSLSSQAQGELVLAPLLYDWPTDQKPPWVKRADGCNFTSLLQTLPLRVQEFESPFGGTYVALLDEGGWGYLRLYVLLCPLKEIRNKGEHNEIYILAHHPRVPLIVVKHGVRQTIYIELQVRLTLSGESDDRKKKMQGLAGTNALLRFGGLVSWYTIEHFPESLRAIRRVILDVIAPVDLALGLPDPTFHIIDSWELSDVLRDMPPEKKIVPPIKKKELDPQGCC